LTSSGASGNVYWSTVSLGVNTAGVFSWTNSHVFSNTVTINASTLSVGNTVANTTVTLGTITISNGAAVATVNATVYSGTANNSAALSGVSLSTIQSQITGNAATAYSNATTYSSNATALSSGTVPTARLGSGVANSSTYLRGDQTWATTGTVTSVATGTGLTGGPVTGTGTISLATIGSSASYSSGISAISVDAYGRVTSVTGSAGYVTSSGYGYGSSPTFSSISASSLSTSGAITAYGTSYFYGGLSSNNEVKGASLVSSGGTVYLNDVLSTAYMQWNGTYIAFNRPIFTTGTTTTAGVSSSAGITATDIGASGRFYGSGTNIPVLNAKNGGANYVYFAWNDTDLVYTIDGSLARAISYAGSSDRRLKTNISNTDVDSLSIVNSIGLKKFDWTDEGLKYNNLKDEDKSVKIGIVAQELAQVIPEAIVKVKDEKDVETQLIRRENIVPYLIGAIQEQQKQIADLQAQINLLKK
jgi:hypothetical protein